MNYELGKEMDMISFIYLVVGLYEVLEVYLTTFKPLNLGTIKPSQSIVWLNIFSKFFTKHQAQSTMHKLSSYAQNSGKKPLHQVSNLNHFVPGSVPAVRNLTRQNINEINGGWLRTCTAGQASVPEVNLLYHTPTLNCTAKCNFFKV
jgi:hypothetical protein